MTKLGSERGAILVHAALALLGLFLFTGFVVDLGALWVARGQAQNAADAGALAGGVARLYDDTSNPPGSTTSGVIYESVVHAVANHIIWGVSPPANTVTIGWTCPDDGSTNCIVVDVYRDGTHNSARVPTFFMGLANVTSQGMRAHAVAKLAPANHADCLRPWFMIDQYTDVNGDGHYGPGDTYAAPGYQLPRDLGAAVTFHNNLSPSGFGQVDFGSGGKTLREAIKHCTDLSVTIGDVLQTQPGGVTGPESMGVNDVYDWDPSATWDGTKVVGGCAATHSCVCDGQCPNGPSVSPRVFVTAVCSPLDADCALGGPNNGQITVTNLLAFFITARPTGNGNNLNIPAVLIGTSGTISSSLTPTPGGSFLYSMVLIR